jgi:hypothetical protein
MSQRLQMPLSQCQLPHAQSDLTRPADESAPHRALFPVELAPLCYSVAVEPS